MEQNARKLIEKYWDAETSLEEEKQIKQQFAESGSDQLEGAYFSAIAAIKSRKMPDTRKKRGPSTYMMTMAMAASIILLAIAVVVFKGNTSEDEFAIEDPEVALEITKELLLKVSEGLNEAQTYSGTLENFDLAKNKVLETN